MARDFLPVISLPSIARAVPAVFMILLLGLAAPARAERASIVIDAGTGEVLHSQEPHLRSFPASTTKLMTVYLAFEALEAGTLNPEEPLPVSAHAAAQTGTTLGLVQGETIPAEVAIQAVIVRSANDAAVVLAERLAGSESTFAERMTAKAKTLGMQRTVFRNATGLPHAAMTVTAFDLATLALAHLRDFPRHYAYFGRRLLRYGQQTLPTYNGILVQYDGADGMKTGFTCAAGYNLVASALRNGRRLVGVVLGEMSGTERTQRMMALLNQGFAKPAGSQTPTMASLGTEAAKIPDPAPNTGVLGGHCGLTAAPGTGTGIPPGWSVLIAGQYVNAGLAQAAGRRMLGHFPGGRLAVINRHASGPRSMAPVVVGIDRATAVEGCRALREKEIYCLVFDPGRLSAAVTLSQRIARMKRKR